MSQTVMSIVDRLSEPQWFRNVESMSNIALPWVLTTLMAFYLFVPPILGGLRRVARNLIWLVVSVRMACKVFWRNTRDSFLGQPRYNPESTMPGSPFVPVSKLPKFQCMVLGNSRAGADPVQVGVAFRFEDWIVTAWHVVECCSEMWLSVEGETVPISKSSFDHLEGDIAYAPFSKDLGRLGLSKPKIRTAGTGRFDEAYVQVAGGSPLSQTNGALKPSRSFGYVRYTGSTKPGFSGAPYYQHVFVYGMHLGGGTENLGLDATYLHSMLLATRESTPDILDKVMFGRQPIAVRSFGNKYMAKTGSGYKNIMYEDYVELSNQGRSWADMVEDYEGEANLMYDDEEPTLQENFNRAALRAARVAASETSSQLSVISGAVSSRCMRKDTEIQELRDQISQLRKLLINYHEQILVQGKIPTQTTETSTSELKKQQENLRQKSSGQLSKTQKKRLRQRLSKNITGEPSMRILKEHSGILTQDQPPAYVTYKGTVRPLEKSLDGMGSGTQDLRSWLSSSVKYSAESGALKGEKLLSSTQSRSSLSRRRTSRQKLE
ncbi:hypothetical protein 1 [Hubei sobemo-like virus 14]|uniref:hypothetical protein 1 n=1 Tax=Hubei sobemo-like virus 14 TaxID=1923199 RepID=UPI00090A28CF|nr:hypothetical protein 1 [Hubei sobemo-like virus 14]APG75801.1 hypothetical protein 1 [Hubei sobemo-like virus 14]